MYIVCVFTVVYFIVKKPDIHVCIWNNKVILNLNFEFEFVLEMAPPFNVAMRATGEYTTMCVVRESPDTQQALPQGLSSPGKN